MTTHLPVAAGTPLTAVAGICSITTLKNSMRKIVLLIDDDYEDQDFFISTLLEYNESIEVVSAFNGSEALHKLKTIKPSCIFLDINMPSINGIEVLRKLKENENTQHIPVYMYSTSDGYNSKPIAIKLGAEKYFRKPETPEKLKRIFKEAFK